MSTPVNQFEILDNSSSSDSDNENNSNNHIFYNTQSDDDTQNKFYNNINNDKFTCIHKWFLSLSPWR